MDKHKHGEDDEMHTFRGTGFDRSTCRKKRLAAVLSRRFDGREPVTAVKQFRLVHCFTPPPPVDQPDTA
nr:hypothetical protein [Paraburkholderia caribensis]